MKNLLNFSINFIIDKGIFWPLYFPILFSMKKLRVSNVNKDKKLAILAINHSRFRGDLEVFAKEGFEVYKMPYKWQTRVFHAYKDLGSKREFQNPPDNSQIIIDRSRLRSYLSKLLEKIFNKKGINCVIGAGLFYNQDLDWGAATTEIGYPYIVFHRENLAVNRDTYLDAVKKAKRLNKMGFVGTSIVFQNTVMKGVYDKYSGVNPDLIHALGATRMDQYIRDIGSKKNTLNNNRITLFTFPSSNSILPENLDDYGWHELHDEVHNSFVELAKENTEVEFVIKHKGVAWSETELLLQNIGAFNIPNLKIYGELDYDTHKLILESDVITGFCSTALLEAAIAKKPIVFPLFAEADSDRYSELVCFSDSLGMFDTVKSKEEYKKMLIQRLKKFEISERVVKLRGLQFAKYVSSLDSNATQKYSELIINESKKNRGYR